MKIGILFTILFLTSFLRISFAFTCSDLSENQCNELKTNGCIWSGTACGGSYSLSCAPLTCYFVDPNSMSTATPDGTPEKPLKTLPDGFTKIAGKNGILMIVNILENVSVSMTRTASPTSNITIKPLFEEKRVTIDFSQVQTLVSNLITIKKSFTLIGINLVLPFGNSFVGSVFSVGTGGELYFENVDVKNSSRNTLVTTRSSTFSMVNSRFTDAWVSFSFSSDSSILWRNVYGNGVNNLGSRLFEIKTMTMEDCFFTGMLGPGFILASAGPSEILLKNCTFQDLISTPAVSITSATKLTIENCIFAHINSNTSIMFQFTQDNTGFNNFPSVIKNTSFTNIFNVTTSLLYLEGRTVRLSLINVTMDNITQLTQQIDSSITFITLADELALPRGICGISLMNAQLSIEHQISQTFL